MSWDWPAETDSLQSPRSAYYGFAYPNGATHTIGTASRNQFGHHVSFEFREAFDRDYLYPDPPN